MVTLGPTTETAEHKLHMAMLELKVLKAALDARNEMKATDEELEEVLRRIVDGV